MKRSLPTRIPEFSNDEEIAAFMEQHSGFDLLDKGLATVVRTPLFGRKQKKVKAILKDKRVEIAFKDERSLKKAFASIIPPGRTFRVIDADLSGILLSLSDVSASERFYVPYLNISGIKILGESKRLQRTKSL